MINLFIINSMLFGANKIPFDNLINLHKNVPDVIVYAIPAMAFFTLLEIGYSWYHNHKFYQTKESIGSTLVGLGNVAISLVLKIGLLYAVVWIYNIVPWRMSLAWWTFLPCYIIF